MKITQGTFSFLPPLTDEQIRAQVDYMLQHGWAVSIEYTDDPHPRNTYWNMWGLPLFDARDAAPVMDAVAACCKAHAACYVKVNGYDPSPLRQGQVLSFIVHRPTGDDAGYRLVRGEGAGQAIGYTLQPYVADRPAGKRYDTNGE